LIPNQTPPAETNGGRFLLSKKIKKLCPQFVNSKKGYIFTSVITTKTK